MAHSRKTIYTCFLFIAIISVNLCSQVTVTFELDMQSLIDQNFFSPSDSERVFIRGNFNQWQGEDYELKRNRGNHHFIGKYDIHLSIGDTLEYKFILIKNEGQVFWERNPNPENPDHGNRRLIITQSKLTLPVAKFDYDEFISYPIIFNTEKLQEDFMQMRQALEETHPALYDYIEKDSLDSLFNYYYQQIDTPLTFNDFYKLLSSVIVKIGCGHTKLWIPSDYWNIVPKRLFPLKIVFSHGKVFVSGYYSSSTNIPIGSEIIAINEMPIQNVIQTLESLVSSDGHIQSFKSKTVEKNFAKNYALYYGFPKAFKVQYIDPAGHLVKEILLRPVGIETINKYPVRGNELSLQVLEKKGTAILTINTFIYYDQLDMFKSFIDSSFNVIQTNGIKNLIMDLRGNDGGDPFCASYLFSYLEYKEVPYFSKPYGKYTPLAEPLALARNHFQGKLFTLIDGSGFSTNGHFCALLKYHKIGKLVGMETGSTFTCTGNVRYLNLLNTRLIFGTAREQRYRVAVENMDRKSGVLPDYHVEQSQNDLVAGKDTVLDFALGLIEN